MSTKVGANFILLVGGPKDKQVSYEFLAGV